MTQTSAGAITADAVIVQGLEALHEYNQRAAAATPGTVIAATRLPPETKAAFDAAAKALGETPSSVQRRLIGEWLERVSTVVEWGGKTQP